MQHKRQKLLTYVGKKIPEKKFRFYSLYKGLLFSARKMGRLMAETKRNTHLSFALL